MKYSGVLILVHAYCLPLYWTFSPGFGFNSASLGSRTEATSMPDARSFSEGSGARMSQYRMKPSLSMRETSIDGGPGGSLGAAGTGGAGGGSGAGGAGGAGAFTTG